MVSRKTFLLHTVILLFTLLLSLSPWNEANAAGSAQEKFLAADAAYQRLRKNIKKQKYRDQWLLCIDKYKAVYRHAPKGPWAAAGLYYAGDLYLQLHRWSSSTKDLQAAEALFEQIRRDFPKSRYRPKAVKQLTALKKKIANASKTTARRNPAHDRAKRSLQRAKTRYTALLNSPRHQKYRDRWLACINGFQKAYQEAPDGPQAAEALFLTAEAYGNLYKRSFRGSDKANSKAAYQDVLNRYPDSNYAARAAKALGDKAARTAGQAPPAAAAPPSPAEQKQQALDRLAQLIAEQEGDPTATTAVSAPSGGLATIKKLRHWSNPSYTRIVIDVDRDVHYSHRLLRQDRERKKPQRLYVDLKGSRMGRELNKYVPINDNLLLNVRAGQYQPTSVRVVVDIKSYKTYKIFSLKNPFRIVVDVWGVDKGPTVVQEDRPQQKLPPSSLAKQLALGVRRIVIDPGHGGKDFGAPGYLKGVHEKQVVMEIAQRLSRKIERELGLETVLTRARDTYLTLEERTALANTKSADLFISIHTNAARDRRAYGIETYFLNLATDESAIQVAARENATSAKNISDLESILNDLMQNAKINESSRLAARVQQGVVRALSKNYTRIKDKGVKQAPFYVLMGAQMPAILVETSFISNSRECKRLKDPKYQEHLCAGIIAGIRQYIREINPMALNRPATAATPSG
ncbi:MAG: N-acetylmuramoyl-L-alanine amidase [Desulfosarcinaceae bacterium]|nr:N-acetylmuramoyl-L-alanine amidase [Desulfosarcinaceae bacterium]